MDYSSKYFNKPLRDLAYEDIGSFFNVPREESTMIEFKSFSTGHGNIEKSMEGIIKGICAFLNSEGGILIWGAPKGKKEQGKTEKKFQGSLSPLKERKEKDWLINKISDSIIPLTLGIEVKLLRKHTNYVYVFEVQKSNYSPHQFQNVYYARLDGQNKPAPHYFVEALMRKTRYPNLEGYIKILGNSGNIKNGFILNLEVMILNFSPFENEENVFFRLFSPQQTFFDISNFNIDYERTPSKSQLEMLDYKQTLHFGEVNPIRVQMYIDHASLLKDGKLIKILLTFGGRRSPLKVSEYMLDFSRISDVMHFREKDILASRLENMLVSEQQRNLGKSKDDILKDILER